MDFSRPLLSNIAAWGLAAGEAARSEVDQIAHSAAERVTASFLELGGGVQRYLFHACRHHQDAEELTQETFLRLYRALAASQEIENVRHWVFRVAHNLVIDRSKRKRRTLGECDLSDDIRDVVPDPRPTPEDALLKRGREAAVRMAVSELTELQQRCFRLRAEGLTLREIAEVLDMDIRRVAEAIQRAIQNIQRRTRGV